MFPSFARSLSILALGFGIGAGLSIGASARSGFLKDYARLKPEKDAAGKSKHDVKLEVEWEITDGGGGEALALVVRDARGFELTSGEKLNLAMVKPRIDDWAESVRQSLAARMKSGGK